MQAIPFLVLGDVMIDNYYHGSVQRISPEAPVPVVKVNAVKKYPGGAGNVVSNLAGLGAQLSLIAGIGDDEDGRWLAHHYKEKSLNFLPLIWDKPTIIKSRILGGRQQILRFDREEAGDLTAQEEDQLLGRLQDFDSHGIQGIVLSDYNKGFCTPKICQWVIKMAQEKQIPVFVDPKGNTWDKYTGAFLVTPNLSELSLVYGETVPNQNQAVVEAGQFLLQKYQLNNLLITRSEMGMTLIQKDSVNHFPTEAQEVYDVSGAGDTVIATVSYLLASGMDPEEAVRLANQAAGIAVAHSGTWSIDALTLSRLMHQNFPW
jgi:rfaE bifunctional protein kinase chain/domain